MRIGLTNGVFDTFHRGHEYFLQRVWEHCDYLVCAVNSDESAKRLKGEDRPVNTLRERLQDVAPFCAAAIPFDGNTFTLIEAIRPAVYAKGSDWEEDKIIGLHLLKSYGGQLLLIPRLEGYSTTQILAQSR
jgi:rfaE bifunctional protein nucleotidyltransferase chain/domain